MLFTYILFSAKLNKYYVGACSNLERRFYEHNMGHSRFTKSDLPWILVWQKEFEALPEAKQFEAKINPILPNDLCNGLNPCR